jgi:hypothetical protein
MLADAFLRELTSLVIREGDKANFSCYANDTAPDITRYPCRIVSKITP